MPNNYFSIRDCGVITCYVSPNFRSITEVIAALSRAFRAPAAQSGEPGTETAHLLANAGAHFKTISVEEWNARVAELEKQPSEDRRVEINFDTDCIRFTDWRGGQYASITGSLRRIPRAYDDTLAKGKRFTDGFIKRIAGLCDVDIIRAAPDPAQAEGSELAGPTLGM